ncbi:MAG TPA: ATP-binding protein [Candidatus Acidoferrales bacterium]
MAVESQIETTKIVLKELFDRWDVRANLCREIMYSSALRRRHEGTWHNVFTYFLPLSTAEERSVAVNVDYGDFTINRGLLSLSGAKDVLTEIAAKQQMSLPGQRAVEIEAYLYPGSSRRFLRSDSRNYPVLFPSLEYRFSITNQCVAEPPGGTIWAPELPLYPSGHSAIEDLLDTRLGDVRSYTGVLCALAPDYRGKIAGIRLRNDGVEVHAVCMAGADPTDMSAKLYSEDDYGNRTIANLEFDTLGNAFAATSGFPRHLVVVLFSKSGHDIIDERIFDSGSPYLPGDLSVEAVEQDVENILKGGESDTLEFKSQIPKQQEAIARTAVAFANRKGGRIVLGVENDGQIVGCPDSRVKDTLTQILRDNCHPSIDFVVSETTISSKLIFVVIVPEGKSKPYQLRDKGFYIRSGATNRLVTRYELDEMYGGKSSIAGFGTLPILG